MTTTYPDLLTALTDRFTHEAKRAHDRAVKHNLVARLNAELLDDLAKAVRVGEIPRLESVQHANEYLAGVYGSTRTAHLAALHAGNCYAEAARYGDGDKAYAHFQDARIAATLSDVEHDAQEAYTAWANERTST